MTNSPPSHSPPPERKAPRWLLWGPLLVFGLIFAVYFFAWQKAASIMEDEVYAWVENERLNGAEVSHGAIKMTGFPFFLRAKVSDPELRYPDVWGWSGELLTIDASPLQPDRLVFVPQGILSVHGIYQGQKRFFVVNADQLHITLSETAYALQTMNLTAIEKDGLNTKLSFAKLVANYDVKESPENGKANDFATLMVDGENLAYKDNTTSALTLPILEVSLSASAMRTLDQSNLTRWGDNGGTLYMDRLRIMIGEEATETNAVAPSTQIAATGKLTVKNGFPDGLIDAKIRNPDVAIDWLVGEGAIPLETGAQAKGGFAVLSGDKDEVKGQFTLQNGELKIGPLKLMDLPKVN